MPVPLSARGHNNSALRSQPLNRSDAERKEGGNEKHFVASQFRGRLNATVGGPQEEKRHKISCSIVKTSAKCAIGPPISELTVKSITNDLLSQPDNVHYWASHSANLRDRYADEPLIRAYENGTGPVQLSAHQAAHIRAAAEYLAEHKHEFPRGMVTVMKDIYSLAVDADGHKVIDARALRLPEDTRHNNSATRAPAPSPLPEAAAFPSSSSPSSSSASSASSRRSQQPSSSYALPVATPYKSKNNSSAPSSSSSSSLTCADDNIGAVPKSASQRAREQPRDSRGRFMAKSANVHTLYGDATTPAPLACITENESLGNTPHQLDRSARARQQPRNAKGQFVSATHYDEDQERKSIHTLRSSAGYSAAEHNDAYTRSEAHLSRSERARLQPRDAKGRFMSASAAAAAAMNNNSVPSYQAPSIAPDSYISSYSPPSPLAASSYASSSYSMGSSYSSVGNASSYYSSGSFDRSSWASHQPRDSRGRFCKRS